MPVKVPFEVSQVAHARLIEYKKNELFADLDIVMNGFLHDT